MVDMIRSSFVPSEGFLAYITEFYLEHSQQNGGQFENSSKPSRTHRPLVKSALVAVVLCLSSVFAWATPPPSPYNRALVEFQSGNFRQASVMLENALQRSPDSASAELLLARCYYELKDWDQAALHAESAEKMESQNAEVHLWLGQIYGRKAEEEHSLTLAVKTRKEFEKAVSLDPSNVDARCDLMTFYLDAPWVLGGGKGKALKQAEAIATLDPVEGALARAHYYEKLGQASQAGAEFRKALELKPKDPGPYFEAANFYESGGDVEDMRASVEAAAKLNPRDPRLPYYLGATDAMEGKRLTEAERDLKSYLAAGPHRSDDPSQASAMSWLGQVYERLGQSQLATKEYMAALALDSHLNLALQGLQRLQTKTSER
jgi:Tfp pilus assembly protein PilF